MASKGCINKKRPSIEITESIENRIVERLRVRESGSIANIARAFNCPVAQIQAVNDKYKIRPSRKEVKNGTE